MPGFGTSGPFGNHAFGEFDWSRKVLFQFMPELHKLADLEQNGLLEAYADAIGISYDQLRRKIRQFGELRNPLLIRTQYDEVIPIKLGRRVELLGPVEQRGVQASVDAVQAFVTQRGRFTQADLGKELTVSESALEVNNTTVRVASVLGPKTITTDPPLATDPGPLTWTIRVGDQTPDDQIIVEVASGDMDLVAPSWLIRDGRTEVEVLSRTQFKPESEESRVLTDREGSDGFFSGGEFTSPSIRLTQADVGKRITITGSANKENNGKFEIAEVLTSTTLVLDNTDIVAEDGGPLTWAVLKRAELTLRGPSVLSGIVEQRGVDGETTIATGTFVAVSGRFTDEDVGKLLTVRVNGSAVNANLYEIQSVTDLQTVEVDPVFPASEVGAFWEIRTPSEIGDGTDLQARATSLIRQFAQDFGIVIDTREDEEFQRRWVASVSRWIGLKGTENGYRFLGALTGYEVIAVNAMFRITLAIYASLAGLAEVFIVGEPGHAGLDGSLTLVGGRVRFSSLTASFETTDVDRQIFIGNSGSGNDGVIGTIESVLSSTTVEFDSTVTVVNPPAVPTTPTTPDANNGSLEWALVRLYSNQVPEQPLLDEINVDRMTELKNFVMTTVATLADSGGFVELTDAGAFVPEDVGRSIVVSGAGLPAHNGPTVITSATLNTIETTTPYDGVDPNSGSITITATPFVPDKYCFESDWSTTLGPGDTADGAIFIDSANPVVSSVIPITYTVQARGDFDVIASIGEGRWKITDSIGNPNFIEVVPSEVTDVSVVGADTVLAPDRIQTAAATFAASDLYKRIRITSAGNPANEGVYIISAVNSPTEVELDTTFHTLASAEVGTIDFDMFHWEFTVVSTTPPVAGSATLEYLCPEVVSCDFCKSNKVRIEAVTPFALEKGTERLLNRLEEVRPEHVEIVQAFGVHPTALFSMTATVTHP